MKKSMFNQSHFSNLDQWICFITYEIAGLKKILRSLPVFLKGNQNCYCRKQHKNIKNSQIIEQNIVSSLCDSLCLLRLAFPSPSSTVELFQFLGTVLRKF